MKFWQSSRFTRVLERDRERVVACVLDPLDEVVGNTHPPERAFDFNLPDCRRANEHGTGAILDHFPCIWVEPILPNPDQDVRVE